MKAYLKDIGQCRLQKENCQNINFFFLYFLDRKALKLHFNVEIFYEKIMKIYNACAKVTSSYEEVLYLHSSYEEVLYLHSSYEEVLYLHRLIRTELLERIKQIDSIKYVPIIVSIKSWMYNDLYCL